MIISFFLFKIKKQGDIRNKHEHKMENKLQEKLKIKISKIVFLKKI